MLSHPEHGRALYHIYVQTSPWEERVTYMQTQLRWCLLAITCLALLSAGRAQEGQPPFSITISTPQTVKAGAPVSLFITVKNISSSQISIDIGYGRSRGFRLRV